MSNTSSMPVHPSTPRKTCATSRLASPASPATPRKRRAAIKPSTTALTAAAIRQRSIDAFSLDYIPDDWQVEIIKKVHEGHDSIFVAGTGYGKSYVFETLALLGQSKAVLVVCPLKALEYDQATQATAKGLRTVVLNEDTAESAENWKVARLSAQLIYMSPEMALSSRFDGLFKDGKFRNRLKAFIVDEAHCIDDWGEDDFRPLYRQLNRIRPFTGMEVPFLACTATCRTSTFNLLWDTLGFGDPFRSLCFDRDHMSHV